MKRLPVKRQLMLLSSQQLARKKTPAQAQGVWWRQLIKLPPKRLSTKPQRKRQPQRA